MIKEVNEGLGRTYYHHGFYPRSRKETRQDILVVWIVRAFFTYLLYIDIMNVQISRRWGEERKMENWMGLHAPHLLSTESEHFNFSTQSSSPSHLLEICLLGCQNSFSENMTKS